MANPNSNQIKNKSSVSGESLTDALETLAAGGTGGGVTDHGLLSGLGDDDHTQYYNQSRGDARYSQVNHAHLDATTGVSGFMSDEDKVKLNSISAGATVNDTDVNLKNRENHTGVQAIATVSGLQDALDSKQATLVSGTNIKTINGVTVLGSGDIAISGSGVTDHGALTGLADDDHTQYHNDARGDARYAQISHSHAVVDVTGLQAQLDEKQATLVSATNIKTINGSSVLGSGDLVITPGVTDHGLLTGLGDDDHAQYLNNTRGDARYSQLAHTHAATSLTASGASYGNTVQWGNASAFTIVPSDALVPTGLAGDGTTDDRAAIQAALDTGRPVYLPATASGYKISNRLIFAFGNQLFGDERKTKVIGPSGDWFCEIRAGNVVIQNLLLDFSAGAGGCFLFRTDINDINRCFIRNIESTAANNFILDTGTSFSIVYLSVENCIASAHRGAGVTLNRAFAYLKMRDVTIDYVGSASRNHVAFRFVGNQGAQLAYLDVTNGLVDGTNTADGFQFENCIAVWMNNCMADTVPGAGFNFITGCSYIYMANCVGSLCGGSALKIQSGSGTNLLFNVTGFVASGRVGQGVAPAGAHGIEYAGGRSGFVNTTSVNNTGDGFSHLSAGFTAIVSGGVFRSNGGRGIKAAGTGSFMGTGLLMSGNTGGNYDLAGSLQHIQASMNTSGALVNVTGPSTA